MVDGWNVRYPRRHRFAVATGAILLALVVEIFLAVKAREPRVLTAPKKAFAS